jgi:hypothetical protein
MTVASLVSRQNHVLTDVSDARLSIRAIAGPLSKTGREAGLRLGSFDPKDPGKEDEFTSSRTGSLDL